MKKAFLAALAAATLFGAAGSASAGVITTGSGVAYTATLTGDLLNLEIDATGIKSDLKRAVELDGIAFDMFDLSGVTLVSAPTSGWTYTFTGGTGKADRASFYATAENELPLDAPMSFQFKFIGDGAPLAFNKLALTTDWLTGRNHSTDVVQALNVTVVAPAAAGADKSTDLPEPASGVLMAAGLGLLGLSRRKFERG